MTPLTLTHSMKRRKRRATRRDGGLLLSALRGDVNVLGTDRGRALLARIDGATDPDMRGRRRHIELVALLSLRDRRELLGA